jgi:hypothetical protein
MSIDAVVTDVVVNSDGSGELRLGDRPPQRPGDNAGIAGQSVLSFEAAPADVVGLAGRQVWGGESSLMLGERQIARRDGYTRIVFTCDPIFPESL